MLFSIIDRIGKWMKESVVDEILLFALLVALAETCAQNTLKNSKRDSVGFLIGIQFYILVGYILHWGYNNFPISKVNVIWSCVSIITAVLLGLFIYHENVNLWSLFAVIFACLAVYCSYKS